MGSLGTIAVTAGSGTSVGTFVKTSGSVHHQLLRLVPVDGETDGTWTLAITAATSVIAADVNRVRLLMWNNGSARVYMRFDTTAPTSANAHWFLEPGERWMEPEDMAGLVHSFLAAGVGGTLNYWLGTNS
jgi:hypothetical protein